MTEWSLSSSSEDDEDAHFFQSKIKDKSVYYEKFLKDDFGTDDWADHIPGFINLGLNDKNGNHSFGNYSMSNGAMTNALHLPCTVPDRVMVYNRDSGIMEVMRFVEMSNGEVIPPEPVNLEVNLPDSTMNGISAGTSTINNSFNPLASPNTTSQLNGGMKSTPKSYVHKTKLIPLEPVDLVYLVDFIDRRKKKPEPEELMELPFPSFYHIIEWNGKKWVKKQKSGNEKNEPKLDRSQGFKLSMSYQRERRDRIYLHKQRDDPRLKKGLFSSPKRVEAHTSKELTKDNIENIFGSESDSSMTRSHSRSHSHSPSNSSSSFLPFNTGSDFAAERNSTFIPADYSENDSTSSDISESDTFEEKTERKLRSRTKKNRKRGGKENMKNEKVPPLVIKLPKTVNSAIDQRHSMKNQPKKKEYTNIVPPKLLKPPKEIYELKNDVLAAMQGEFPDDECLKNKDEVETQSNQSINQNDNAAAKATETMEMDVDDDSVAETTATANEQRKETPTKATEFKDHMGDNFRNDLELDEVSDDELMNEQPAMVSHGRLTDLEDVSMDESVENNAPNLDNLYVDEKVLDEAVKEVFGEDNNVEHQLNTTTNSEIEKSLALFDDVETENTDGFVEAKANDECTATPNQTNSIDRNELIKILDPNSSEEQNVNAVANAECGPENVQTEQEADNFVVPEIGATADVGAITNDHQSHQINLDIFNDVNSFGRPRNMLPDSADETHRLKITIPLLEYAIAENELQKLLCEDDNDEEQVEPMAEKSEEAEHKQDNITQKDVNDEDDENDERQSAFDLIETSEDDQEYDLPIPSENFVVPNSNTDRRVTQTNLECTMCPYKDLDGWKKLTKHYLRKHPGTEIAHSRLAERFKLDEIIENPICSTITGNQLQIKSICLFCDQYYCLNSSKWEKHFVSHTGECPFKCQKCGLKLFDNLHKRCNSQNNIVINGPHEFKDNKLFGYVCALCHFVQLDKKNIFNHIDNQHQAMAIDESIVEILLINVTETETPSIPSNTDSVFVEIDSDDEDDKPLKKRSATEKSASKILEETIDLTLSDSDPDVD